MNAGIRHDEAPRAALRRAIASALALLAALLTGAARAMADGVPLPPGAGSSGMGSFTAGATATPASATPASATPASATPASATPASATADSRAEASPPLSPIPVLPIDYSIPLRVDLGPEEAKALPVITAAPGLAAPADPLSELARLASGGPMGNIAGFDFSLHNSLIASSIQPAALDARLEVARQGGLVDFHLDIKGDKSLQQGTGMALAYDGAAMIEPESGVELGVVSKGTMGTLGNPSPGEDGYAGPMARFSLSGIGRGLTAETGYLFATSDKSSIARDQFSLKLDLPL